MKPKVYLILKRNRLIQFAIGGAVLFLMAPRNEQAKVSLSQDEVKSIFAAHAQRKGYSSADQLPEKEKRMVLTRLLQDELLYREGTRLELEKNDHIVRQRLIQKVLFLAEELEGAATPTNEADLKAFFQSHLEQYRRPASFAFDHVYASDAKTLKSLKATVQRYSDKHPKELPPFGQAFPLTRSQPLGSINRIREVMGEEFTDQIQKIAVGKWSEPISSKFGYHLVRVNQSVPSYLPSLDEVRNEVKFEYEIHRKQELTARYLSRLYEKEPIHVEGYRPEELKPTVESLQLPSDSRVED